MPHRLVGIDVNKVLTIAFALGIGLTVLAGGVLVPSFYAFPTVGSSFVLISFVAVVRGGRSVRRSEPGFSARMRDESLERYAFPDGPEWRDGSA